MSSIYHLAPAERWRDWPTERPYLPAEYAADGFIHCTAGDELMLRVANRFYRDAPGEFVLLVIDAARLSAPLRWEAPAPPTGSAEPDLAPLFPHIYGPIDRAAIVEVRAVRRAPDGTFLGW
jgi:uncharacterized protein (DUF952 family)